MTPPAIRDVLPVDGCHLCGLLDKPVEELAAGPRGQVVATAVNRIALRSNLRQARGTGVPPVGSGDPYKLRHGRDGHATKIRLVRD